MSEFTGQEHDDETQFDFFHARYLSAAQQRFLSPDPGNAGANPFDPQSWNAYSYVLNNPLSNVDPTGQDVDQLGNCYFNYYVDPETGNKSYGSVVCLAPGGGSAGGDQDATPPPPVKFTTTVTASAPKNAARPSWLNNITSIFGYDQRIKLPSCAALTFNTALDDLNPFSPSTFGAIKEGVEGALVTGQFRYFNAAMSHAAARGLTYPNKSSIFRGLLKTSGNLGKAAGDYLGPAAVDAALVHGLILEIRAMSRGECQ